MSDLNNIRNITGNVGKNQELTKKVDSTQIVQQNDVEPTNLGEIPTGASVLGRSMVSHDCTKSDITFGMKNPEIIEKCDTFFENAFNMFAANNDPEAYEKACMLTSAFANEISK